MSRRRLFDRIDDWLNPIVVKELRQAVKSKLVVAALLLFLFLQLIILGTMLLTASAKSSSGELDMSRGRDLFNVLQGIMLGTCMLVPAYVGARLGSERSDTHVDLLFITTLKPSAIILGKFLSGVVLVLLIFSACTPFMTFTYLMRGIDVPTILFLVGVDLVLALGGVAATMFLAVIPAPRPIRGALGLGAFFGLIMLFSGGMGLTQVQLHFGGMGTSMDSWTFWGPMLYSLLMIAGGCGLLFTWSIAILSPPSANKALPIRLYVLLFTVVSGVASYVVSDLLKDYIPMAYWLAVAANLACVQLFLSVNEREELGPRITRSIPRLRVLRLPAFLLFSGSAGGIIFSVLLLLSCMGTSFFVLSLQGEEGMSPMFRYSPSPVGASAGGWMDSEILVEMIRFATVMSLYTYCYCLTAVIVRRAVFRSQLRPGFTWLVSLLLTGLGSVVPYLILYFVFQTNRSYGEDDASMLTNPFVTISNAMDNPWRRRDPFDFYGLQFLLVWAFIATGVALPWMLKQFVQFAPRKINVNR